jgi:hypothetical protein
VTRPLGSAAASGWVGNSWFFSAAAWVTAEASLALTAQAGPSTAPGTFLLAGEQFGDLVTRSAACRKLGVWRASLSLLEGGGLGYAADPNAPRH